MMKFQEFERATLKEKMKMLMENGSNIATRTTDHYYVRLYILDSSYVEVWSSSHIPWHDVVKIKLLKEFTLLKPYLPHVFFSQQNHSTV